MDLTEIRASAFLYSKNHTGPSFMSLGEAETAARSLALAVPDLLAEIERLTTIAREGWQEAHDAAENEGDGQTMDLAAKRLAAIGGAS